MDVIGNGELNIVDAKTFLVNSFPKFGKIPSIPFIYLDSLYSTAYRKDSV